MDQILTDKQPGAPRYSAKTPVSSQPTCWICGAPANTGEHRTKKSDLKAVLGEPLPSAPFHFYQNGRWREIQSLNAKALKAPKSLCAFCNNTRTQPHDRAWEELSRLLRKQVPVSQSGSYIRVARTIQHDTARFLLHVHLFFVKQFGCAIIEGGLPIDTAAFARSILNGRAHPHMYLRFGKAPTKSKIPSAGRTDIWWDDANQPAVMEASWFYHLHNLAIQLTLWSYPRVQQACVGYWHPKNGTTRLRVNDFR